MNIAIIPARSGSKRIKNKNIKLFFGKPLIYYAITAAIKSNVFDKIIVSSDSKKILNIANKYGASTPFLRPKKLSGDNVKTIDVVKHSVEWSIKNYKKTNFFCCIYPASPLLNYKDIINSYSRIKENKFNYVFSVTKYSHPIERSFKINDKNRIKLVNKDFIKKNTQKFENSYHDAGQFYWGKKYAWLKKKEIFSKYSFAYVLPHLSSHDIDDMEDFEVNKKLFKIRLLK